MCACCCVLCVLLRAFFCYTISPTFPPVPHAHTHTNTRTPTHANAHPVRGPQLEAAASWPDAVDAVVGEFEREHGRRITYTICFY